jgi:hypothetical protein
MDAWLILAMRQVDRSERQGEGLTRSGRCIRARPSCCCARRPETPPPGARRRRRNRAARAGIELRGGEGERGARARGPVGRTPCSRESWPEQGGRARDQRAAGWESGEERRGSSYARAAAHAMFFLFRVLRNGPRSLAWEDLGCGLRSGSTWANKLGYSGR